LLGARGAEELQGTHPEHKNKPSEMKPEIVQTQSRRCKTIAVNSANNKPPSQKRHKADLTSFCCVKAKGRFIVFTL